MKHHLAAGLLMCRMTEGVLHYFLVHPGGPYYAKKNAGVWTIPKGLPEGGEQLMDTARREFFEETGIRSTAPYHDIGCVQQKSGKVVHAWTFLGDWDPQTGIICNNFTLEWPPRSGKMVAFPEMDQAKWMEYHEAAAMINPAQIPLLDRAREIYETRKPPAPPPEQHGGILQT